MKYITNAIDMLLQTSEKDSDNETETGGITEDMFEDVMRTLRRKMSRGQIKSQPRECKKEYFYRKYSTEASVGLKASNNRRHTSVDVEKPTAQFFTVKEAKNKRRSEGSLWDIVKDRLFFRARESEASVAEIVASKIETRKKEIKHLTKSQVVDLIRTKYSLNIKTG